MLEDTLIVWGGEFGRTSMWENRSGQVTHFTGRDHNPGAFTVWMAVTGAPAGHHPRTDGRNSEHQVVQNPVEVRDLHATILYLLGFDHHKLNYPFQGLIS